MKQYAVIGLGRFGLSVVENLKELGKEVLAIDNDAKKVERAASAATHAVQADATEAEALRALGLRNFDVAIVCIGRDIKASIITTLALKEAGVRHVVVKAQSDLHGQILTKIGADRVVYPEKEMGRRLAQSLATSSILDFIELSPEYSIVELTVGHKLSGKTLRQLDLREKFGINVMAIKTINEIIVPPKADDIVLEKDILVVIGRNEDLAKLEGNSLQA